MAISQSIPAGQLVSVLPGILSAGGDAIDLNGLMLTNSTRPPIGSVLSFASLADVNNYFGPASEEAENAAIYFAGYQNSLALPGTLLISQYPMAPVAAYVRGASVSALTLAQLQAMTGSLSVTIDGVLKTNSSIVLSAATSFSGAAELIGLALGIQGVSQGTITGSIGGTFTASATTAKVLTVTAVLTGSLQVGDVVSGTDGTDSLPAGCMIVSQLTGSPGSTGTYSISAAPTPGNMTSTTVTSLSTTLDVTADASVMIASGDVLLGGSIAANTYIVSQISGTTGGAGLYAISTAQTAASTTITVLSPGCYYDSVTSAFVIASGTTGATSTIAFPSGTLAASLNLTSALGAVTSQGSIAYAPSTAMNAIITQTTNWAGFTTLFDPDAGSGNAQKLLFATWVSQQNNRYFYAIGDTDITPTVSSTATTSLGYVLKTNGFSGVVPLYDPTDSGLPALALGYAASLNFTRTGGRTTFAYRSQPGIIPSVTDSTVASNLIANGYNFYGKYSITSNSFSFIEPGSISGAFSWFDSYVNQIWLNAQFQFALVKLLQSANSIPYNAVGNTMIATALSDAIQAAGNFGIFSPGVVLAGTQIASVNATAGVDISGILQTRGWYLLIQPSSPATRAARSSPPITFWYVDGGSVQKLSMSSITLQ